MTGIVGEKPRHTHKLQVDYILANPNGKAPCQISRRSGRSSINLSRRVKEAPNTRPPGHLREINQSILNSASALGVFIFPTTWWRMLFPSPRRSLNGGLYPSQYESEPEPEPEPVSG